ncbi:MAG: flagellar protein FliT [Lachnospiraceae bacterium]|nr:flagellar protein FliT [Lachnospiraceae bacterium]
MMNNYLKILEESLIKKNTILDKLQELSDKQWVILNTTPVALEDFDKCVDEKDALLGDLSKLDEGFDTLYENIKNGLLDNKEQYSVQIKTLQQLIQKIMDKSVSIQAQESRNKDMVTAYFKNQKQSFGDGRRSSKAALDYYKSMNKSNVIQPHFMDQKK